MEEAVTGENGTVAMLGDETAMAAERMNAEDAGKQAGASADSGAANSCDLFDEMPDEELLYDLADLFKVFSDTTRIKILFSLMKDELCVADICEATQSTQSAVSHQLRILKQAHLVKFRREGRNVVYSLADDHVYTMLAQGMNHICE
jgi:DNA-binding transcriptional ArsR family regulator